MDEIELSRDHSVMTSCLFNISGLSSFQLNASCSVENEMNSFIECSSKHNKYSAVN